MPNNKFEIVSKYSPSGDQPKAIKQLVENIEHGVKEQVLLGATERVRHLRLQMLFKLLISQL